MLYNTFFSGADLVYNVLTSINHDILKTSVEIKSFMDENLKEKIRILSSVLEASQIKQIDLTTCSSRGEDPEWFEGIIIIYLIFDLNLLYHKNVIDFINYHMCLFFLAHHVNFF